jgi:hypothetical protein
MYASMLRTLTEIDWPLLFVRTYTFVRTLLEVATKQTVKTTKYLVNSLSDDTYYVYNGSYVPISQNNLKPGLGSAEMAYKYNRDTKVLVSLADSTTDNRQHTSNILEATLVLGDLVIYNITEFFDTVEFVSADNNDFPPILTWLGFWSLESGVCLDPTKNFILRVEMLVGSTESFPIWSQDSAVLARWKRLNAPIVLRRQPEVTPEVTPEVKPEVISKDEVPVSNECGGGCEGCTSVCRDESTVNAIMLPAPSSLDERQETTLLPTPTPIPEN